MRCKLKSISLINKTKIKFLIGMLSFFCLTSFVEKPHLIVGCWKVTDNSQLTLPVGDDLTLAQWYFSSDEFTSSISLTKNKEEFNYKVAYKIYENEKGYSKPVIVFKSTCNDDLLIIFTLEELSKESLILKFDEKNSSKSITVNPAQIRFERIAGPPENME